MIIQVEFTVTGDDAISFLSAQLEAFVREQERITYFETTNSFEDEYEDGHYLNDYTAHRDGAA